MKKLFLFLTASCTTLASVAGVSAQTQANSKPMGYVTYTAKGNSDTRIGAPVHRKATFVGKVDTLDRNVITVEGNSPGWGANDFADPDHDLTMDPPIPPTKDLHYVLIASGNLEGRYYEVTSNGSNTLTIDPAGETISGDVGNGTSIKLIAYWTLDSLFPAGEGVHPSPNFAAETTTILTPATMRAGKNLSNTNTFFYYDGSLGGGFATPKWQRAGASPLAGFGKYPFAPDVSLIVRHNIAGDTSIVPIGDVFTTKYRTLVNIIDTGVDQDNAIFLTVPVDVSLAESNLFESGAVAGNSTFDAEASDSLKVFDNDSVGQNKSNDKTYFYYSGASFGGPGWRLAGTNPNIIRDTEVVFSLRYQVLLRKKGAAAGSQTWDMTPNYYPLP